MSNDIVSRLREELPDVSISSRIISIEDKKTAFSSPPDKTIYRVEISSSADSTKLAEQTENVKNILHLPEYVGLAVEDATELEPAKIFFNITGDKMYSIREIAAALRKREQYLSHTWDI